MKKSLMLLPLCLLLISEILTGVVSAVTGDQIAADGSYYAAGEVDFYNDEYTFQLTLAVVDGKISNITQEFTSVPWEEDSEYDHSRALSGLLRQLRGKPAAVNAVDKYAADAVSQATYSYNALRSAVRKALEDAPAAESGEEPVVKYTVSYDLGGAPGDAPADTLHVPGETVAAAAAPVWEGHIFEGWSGQALSGGAFTMPERDVTLTATWSRLVAAVPGDTQSVTAEAGNYVIDIDYSASISGPEENCRLIYALYDTENRMRKVKTEEAALDGELHTRVEIRDIQAGWTIQCFLLDGLFLSPKCRSVRLLFAPKIPDGVYAGSAQCLTGYLNYMVDVEVTVEGGIITAVTDKTLKTPMSSMDRQLYAEAWKGVRSMAEGAAKKAEDFETVDAVSGATLSRRGINSAIKNALSGQSGPSETPDARYAPEGISLYARVYPIVTVSDGRISEIRIVPGKTTDVEALAAFAGEIIASQSVEGLDWPEAIAEDAYAIASLIDQILYGEGVLK